MIGRLLSTMKERAPMYFTLEKLKARMPELIASAIRATQPLEHVLTCPAPGAPPENAMAPAPAADDAAWRALAPGELWGGNPHQPLSEHPAMLGWGIPADGGHNHWLKATFEVPAEWRGGHVLLQLNWDGEWQASPEAILYIDGRAAAGIDQFHKSLVLPTELHEGRHEALLRVYTPIPQPFGGIQLRLRDDTIARLVAHIYTLSEAITTYRDSDPARHALLGLANRAYNLLDTQAGWQSEQYAASAQKALELVEQELGRLRAQARASGPQDGEEAALGARRPVVLGTGHAHLDTAWLWPLWRTRQKAVHTVATALSLMERYPEYRFSLSQPQVYTYLKQDDPELYERLRQRAREGRLEQVGLMWIESDCNVPSGESLVRQFVEGKKFYDADFGAAKHILWLPDVFGYSAALPQILRGCGVDVFMTTKISWNQFNRMPCDTFRWRGIDGSEVLTHFVTATDQPVKPNPTEAQFYTYNGMMTPTEAFGTWQHYRQKNVNDEVLYIYGYGDGGGGPTEEMLEMAAVMSDLPGFPQIQLGRVDEYFERVYERVWDNPETPTWVGELYLEYHRGTYTSQSRTKQNNRASELLYREAEWLNAWATLLGAPSRQEELNGGWRTILLNQFHDILPGSSVPLVYEESNRQFAEVRALGEQVLADAAAFVLENDDAVQGGGQQPAGAQPSSSAADRRASIVVLNTLPWDRDELAAIALGDTAAPPASGETQEVTGLDGSRALLVAAEAPGYGYTGLASASQAARDTGEGRPAALRQAPRAERNILENGLLRVELDQHGEIAALYDLEHGRELVLPGATLNQLVTYEDRPMFWEAWDIDIFYDEKPYPVREILDWKVVEQGPLRAAIEIVRRAGKSTIRQRISLQRGGAPASRRIDFETEVDWQDRQTLLRTLFPLNLNATRATCEIQFGAVERPTHRNTSWDVARFEVCAHRWVDLSEGGYGVALLNNGKYGHSLRDSTLGISLLKAGIHPDPKADEGLHRFTYSLLPHAGDWRQGQVVRRAYELNAPLRPIAQGAAGTPVAGRSAFVQVDSDHAIVETIKQADDGDGLVVRLYEAHNQRGSVRLRFARPVASAVETNLVEQEIGPVEISAGALQVEVRPFEVKTIRVRF
jgi:alpha-mannosidase